MSSLSPPTQIDINGQDERLIINVRNAKYVKLVFEGMTLGVRFEDGVMYTFVETNHTAPIVVEPTQEDHDEDCTLHESTLAESTLTESVGSRLSTTDIREWANGGFDDINEEHEFMIQQEYKWLDMVYEDEDCVVDN